MPLISHLQKLTSWEVPISGTDFLLAVDRLSVESLPIPHRTFRPGTSMAFSSIPIPQQFSLSAQLPLSGNCGRPHIVYSEQNNNYVLWVNQASPGYLLFTSNNPTSGYTMLQDRALVGFQPPGPFQGRGFQRANNQWHRLHCLLLDRLYDYWCFNLAPIQPVHLLSRTHAFNAQHNRQRITRRKRRRGLG
jgi:hypothetical protein